MPDSVPDGHHVARGRGTQRQDLRKRYGANEALKGVDLTVDEGELVGPARAQRGREVDAGEDLVRARAGVRRQRAVNGAPAGSTAADRSLGYLAELFRFPDWLSADELLQLHQKLAGSKRGAAERRSCSSSSGSTRCPTGAWRDVEGHAAAARDRAGDHRRAAAAAARRADERARPGRAADRARGCWRSCARAASPSC